MTHTPEDLVQFVFRSRPSESLDEFRLQSNLSDWADMHRKLDLTGLLILFESTFVGVVEGPRAASIAHLDSMSSDGIFAGLVVLREAGISRRRFETWRFQDLRTHDGDAMLQVTGGLFAQRLSQELYRAS